MATLTKVVLTCDVCGNTKDVQTQAFGLDGRSYEVDLCPKDSKRLSGVAAGYVPKARRVTARQGQRRNGGRPRTRGDTTAVPDEGGAPERTRSGRGHAGGPGQQETGTRRSPRQAAKAGGARQEKAIYVYGILPADIEIAAEMPGVGEDPGLLRLIRSGDLAALVSEVDGSGRLGSRGDRRIHREILDATATEVPVVPLCHGTVLASEDAVAEELLAAHHDEFAGALAHLEGRTEFLVRGRYLEEAVPDQVLSEKRKQDTRALEHAMAAACVDSVVREPAHEREAVHVAFLVAADHEPEVERVIEELARAWEGRIDVQLLGPMAAYDFVKTVKPQG